MAAGSGVRWGRLVLVLVVTLAVVGAGFAVTSAYFAATKQPAPWSSSCTATVSGTSVRLDLEQARNAGIIAGVAGRRGLAPRAVSIGLATAMQESGLRNLDYGDRDSLGLFQQRPSQGWGTAAQVQDPWYASNKFFAALVKVKRWQSADIGEVAQKVQKSGFPDAYDKHVSKARILASALSGQTPAAFTCSTDTLPAGNAKGLAAFLTRTLHADAAISTDGQTVTVVMPSTRSAWSAAAIAIADADTHGVVSVSLGGQTWRHSFPATPAWTGEATPGATRVTITVG